MVQQEADINWEVDSTPVLYTPPLFNDLTLFEVLGSQISIRVPLPRIVSGPVWPYCNRKLCNKTKTCTKSIMLVAVPPRRVSF